MSEAEEVETKESEAGFEEAIEETPRPDTLTIEISVSEVHSDIAEQLREAGVPVEEELANRLRSQIENALHDMFQQGRYQQ